MLNVEALLPARGEWRQGTDALVTATALTQAVIAEDAGAFGALLRGLDSDVDDLRGVVAQLALMGAQARVKAEGSNAGARDWLDVLGALELECHDRSAT